MMDTRKLKIQRSPERNAENDEEMDQTFQTTGQSYKRDSDSFDPEELEFEKFPQLNEDYAKHQLELMSSGENTPNGRSRTEGSGSIREMYRKYFQKDYFLGKNSIDICPGDLILLYDNMGSVLKRNIGYSKFIMRKNDELEDRIRLMEQRNRMLSRELQSVSEKWKREGKMDISR